jgi:hypothetical protein
VRTNAVSAGPRARERGSVDGVGWSDGGGGANRTGVTEPSKSLGPPIVVLVHRTSDNPAGALDHLTSSVFEFLTLPKSVSPVTQILQHIGGKSMRTQLHQLILY